MISIYSIEQAIGAHEAWKHHLQMVIDKASTDIPVERIRGDKHCIFGIWLYGHDLSEEDKAHARYKIVVNLHAQFHKVAAQVAELALAGKQEEAGALLHGEYALVSDRLTSAMVDWKAALPGNPALA